MARLDHLNVTFDYADESDPGPYPIPPNAPIEYFVASGETRSSGGLVQSPSRSSRVRCCSQRCQGTSHR